MADEEKIQDLPRTMTTESIKAFRISFCRLFGDSFKWNDHFIRWTCVYGQNDVEPWSNLNVKGFYEEMIVYIK